MADHWPPIEITRKGIAYGLAIPGLPPREGTEIRTYVPENTSPGADLLRACKAWRNAQEFEAATMPDRPPSAADKALFEAIDKADNPTGEEPGK
jgi:hypothetical protein